MVWAADTTFFQRNVVQYCEFPGPKLPGRKNRVEKLKGKIKNVQEIWQL